MNKPLDMISLPAAAVLGGLPPLALARALVAQLEGNGHAAEPAPRTQAAALPAIGASYQGGIYAGLTLDDGQPAALVLLPGDEQMPWDAARAWAEKQGGTLPSRIDHLVLFQNLKSEFQETWYWSGEQSAHNDAYAWVQSFYYGYQCYYPKDYYYRARAVRRSRLSNSAI